MKSVKGSVLVLRFDPAETEKAYQDFVSAVDGAILDLAFGNRDSGLEGDEGAAVRAVVAAIARHGAKTELGAMLRWRLERLLGLSQADK